MASTNLDAVAQGNADFSRNFLRVLSEIDGNLVSSPISCLIALAMAHAGARGNTAIEMAKGLSLPDNQEVVHKGFAELIQKLKNSPQVELAIANKMYVKNGFPLEAAFVSTLTKSFNASAENVDFLDGATPEIINKWVEEQTKDKIKNLIKQGSFDGMTRLVLVNAVYFKGSWLHPFPKENTQNRDFYLDETNKVEVPFMYVKKNFGYAVLEELDAQLLELPYEGRELSLVVILPNKRTGLAELEEKLATKKLSDLMSKVANREVDVYLPRFKIESTLNLNEYLVHMGLGHVFSDDTDFSGISTAEPLKISKVIQKAFIEVSEEGTIAAAATAVIMATRMMAIRPPPRFEADHPFFFTLINRKPVASLFGGRLTKPEF